MNFHREGRGPSLLLLPGLGCDSRLWQPLRPLLAPHFDLICPHVWGRGSLVDRARQLEELLDRLELRAVGVAGLSMGGYLAFECLRLWPQRIRAAALLDTTTAADDEARRAKRRQVLHLLREDRYEEVLGAFAPSVLAAHHGPDSPPCAQLLAMARQLGAQVFAADVRAILERGAFDDVLASVRVPSLFLAGEEDRLTPPEVARRMAAEVPGAEVAIIAGAGHMTPLEQPQPVGQRLLQFFRSAFDRTNSDSAPGPP